jgi:hypothetical protein
MVSGTQVLNERQMRIAVVISAAILFGLVLVNALALRTLTHDFTNVYAAARIVSQGEGARLYDLQKQAQVEEELFHWGGVFVYLHPPFEAWLFAPLALLPYTAAYVIWGAVNIVLWVFFVYLLRPYVLVPKHPLQYLLLCFVFFPVWIALMQGQTSILLLVLLSLAFVCLKRRRDGWAGVFLGLGLFKFPIVAPLALIFLLKGKWKLVAGFTWAAFMLGVVSIIAVGRAGMIGYMNLLLDTMRRPTYPPYGIDVALMPNLRGFFHVILLPVLPGSAVNGVVVLASAFLIGYVAWRWRPEGPGEDPSLDRMFAAALAISEVTAYYLLIHDLSPMLLAILLTVGPARYPEGSFWRLVGMATVAALYVIPACLLVSGVRQMVMLAPVLVLLAWAAMAGNASGVSPSNNVYADVD